MDFTIIVVLIILLLVYYHNTYEDPVKKNTPPIPLKWQDQGCWNDQGIRALPNCANCATKVKWDFNECKNYADEKGYNAIGLQFGGECWTGNFPENDYKRYGASTSVCNDIGGPWINHVWQKK